MRLISETLKRRKDLLIFLRSSNLCAKILHDFIMFITLGCIDRFMLRRNEFLHDVRGASILLKFIIRHNLTFLRC